MTMTLSGSGTIAGLVAGGLPDATITQPDLAAGVAGNGPILVSGNSVGVSVSSSTYTSLGSYSSAIIDTANCFNTTTGRYTPNVAGYYHVIATVSYGSGGVNSVAVSSLIYKNGANPTILQATFGDTGHTYPNIQTSGYVYMNGTTDYLQVYTYILGSTASNVYGQLQATLVRAA